MKNTRKKILIEVMAFLSILLTPHSSFAAVTIEKPRINGSRVDRCMLEYGETNCSKWGTEQAADALCQKLGHRDASKWWWLDGDSKRNIGTYRLVHTRRNGYFHSYWDWCAECDYYFTKIRCE